MQTDTHQIIRHATARARSAHSTGRRRRSNTSIRRRRRTCLRNTQIKLQTDTH